MLLDRIYDQTLAQASYLIACERTKLAIVIDPTRDIGKYLAAAKEAGVRITHVAETHIHADYVSGARALAARAAATLVLSGEGGDDWTYRYGHNDGVWRVHDGDQVEIGTLRFDVRHTPGHTPEHIAFVVTDSVMSDQPVGMLSGDFIFVGDVGRPDLLERAAHERGTMDRLARQLFQSVRATASLPAHLQLWPGHGAGSACGKALGALPTTTLGYERLANWAFQIVDEDEFVREATAGQPEPPRYFARMKTINRDGPPPASDLSLADLDPAELRQAIASGLMVIDVRATADYAAAHIPGTLNIPIGTSFITWAGSLVPYDRDIVLLADDRPRLERARGMLSLIGLDRVVGVAGAAVRENWWAGECAALGGLRQIDVSTLAAANSHTIVDVRGRAEWDAGHIPNARHYFLGDLLELTKDLPRDLPLALHCQGGTRSAIATSLLQSQGFTNVSNVVGGFRAWESAGHPVEHGDPTSTPD